MRERIAALAALLLSVVAGATPLAAPPATMTPADLQRNLDGGTPLTLLDIRTEEEFSEGHVPGARNIPLDVLAPRMSELPAGIPVVVYCRSGRRTQTAIPQLRQRGYEVIELEGSMLGWTAAGLPAAKPQGTSPSGRTKVK